MFSTNQRKGSEAARSTPRRFSAQRTNSRRENSLRSSIIAVRRAKMGKKSARHDESPPPWSFKPPSPTLCPGKNYLVGRGQGAAWRAGRREQHNARLPPAGTDGMVKSSPRTAAVAATAPATCRTPSRSRGNINGVVQSVEPRQDGTYLNWAACLSARRRGAYVAFSRGRGSQKLPIAVSRHPERQGHCEIVDGGPSAFGRRRRVGGFRTRTTQKVRSRAGLSAPAQSDKGLRGPWAMLS